MWFLLLTLKDSNPAMGAPPYKTNTEETSKNILTAIPMGLMSSAGKPWGTSALVAAQKIRNLFFPLCFSVSYSSSQNNRFSTISLMLLRWGIFNRIWECQGTKDIWVSACWFSSIKWIPHDSKQKPISLKHPSCRNLTFKKRTLADYHYSPRISSPDSWHNIQASPN